MYMSYLTDEYPIMEFEKLGEIINIKNNVIISKTVIIIKKNDFVL